MSPNNWRYSKRNAGQPLSGGAAGTFRRLPRLSGYAANSSIDFSYDEICEFQPLSWEADELAFAIDIIEEADSIMADVRQDWHLSTGSLI